MSSLTAIAFFSLLARLFRMERGLLKVNPEEPSPHVSLPFCVRWIPKTKDNGAAVFPLPSSLYIFSSLSRCILAACTLQKGNDLPSPSVLSCRSLPRSPWTCALLSSVLSLKKPHTSMAATKKNAVCRSAYKQLKMGGMWGPCSSSQHFEPGHL